MPTPKTLTWIKHLPAVDEETLAERNKIDAMLAMADNLEREAATLRRMVRTRRAKLLTAVNFHWTLQEISAASEGADAPAPLPASVLDDPTLSEALRALDEDSTAADVLQAFKTGQVIRQHNLFSTAPLADQLATLHRVFDWWNYGAVPFLARIDEAG